MVRFMLGISHYTIVLSLLLSCVIVSCSTQPNEILDAASSGNSATSSGPIDFSSAKTDPRRLAYDACLQDSMAVSMAWEAIEDQCREQSGWTRDLDPMTQK